MGIHLQVLLGLLLIASVEAADNATCTCDQVLTTMARVDVYELFSRFNYDIYNKIIPADLLPEYFKFRSYRDGYTYDKRKIIDILRDINRKENVVLYIINLGFTLRGDYLSTTSDMFYTSGSQQLQIELAFNYSISRGTFIEGVIADVFRIPMD